MRRIIFGVPKSFSDSAEAQKVIAVHPVNGSGTVYYDPTAEQFGLLTLMSGGFLLVGLLDLISGGISVARSRLVEG